MKRMRITCTLFGLLSLVVLLAWLGPDRANADVPVEGREATQVVNGTDIVAGTGDGAAAVNTSTGNVAVVRAFNLTSVTAGVVVFRDGNNNGTVIGSFYAAANTPYQIGSDSLGGGLRSAVSQCVWVTGPGVVYLTTRYRLER